MAGGWSSAEGSVEHRHPGEAAVHCNGLLMLCTIMSVLNAQLQLLAQYVVLVEAKPAFVKSLRHLSDIPYSHR